MNVQENTASGPTESPLVVQAKNLLALAETDRRGAEDAFEKLGFDAQLETALVLQGDDLQEWLMLSPDLTELVRALPPEHLHDAIKLLGEEDALALIAAASSEQFQAMLDIEWFTEGELDKKKVRRWLELLMELNEEEADQAMQAIDVNALATFLKPLVRPTVSKDYLLLALHMNQHYLFTPEDLSTNDDLVERFLRYLYSVDRDYFGQVLELIVTEESDILSGDMYAGREERLIQRGFPALAKAESLLTMVDPSSYGIQWPKRSNANTTESESSTALRAKAALTPFLLSALAWGRSKGELSERTERAFIQESADIANGLLLAHAKNPSERGVKKEALLAVQVLSSVGLEAVTDSNIQVAAARLKEMDLYELFKLGWSINRTVSQEAWNLVRGTRSENRGLSQPGDDGLKVPSWMPATVWDAVLCADELFNWHAVAATGAASAGKSDFLGEDRNSEYEPVTLRKTQELLTWPRLVRLRWAVEEARERIEKSR